MANLQQFTRIINPYSPIFGNPSSKPPPRIERWALRLQPYQLTVHYRKGEGNPADYLSRHTSQRITAASREEKIAEEYVNYIALASTPKAMTVQEIEEATKADVTLQAVSKAIETGNWYEGTKESSVDAAEFSAWQKVKDELTVAVNPKVILRGTRIAIPKKLQERVVNLAHEGHQGVVKTKSLLREKVWFPRNRQDGGEESPVMLCVFNLNARIQTRTTLDVTTSQKLPGQK